MVLAVGLLALAPSPSAASGPSAQAAFNVGAGGVMLHGYDPIAYFYKNKAMPGSNRFTAKWGGGTYWFSSAQYRRYFLSDPDRFVPQYGGYCAMSVGRGKKRDADPQVFLRRDGLLYVFASEADKQAWLDDESANRAKARQRWEQIQFLDPADT